jgi:branched-subunit amino acid ABC-type transport system permease component
MSETTDNPQADIAGTLHELSEQTRVLVRREIDAAVQEMGQKARHSAPAVVLLAVAAAAGLLAAASSYRLSLRLLEKAMPPATAALTATLGYATAATVAAALGARRLRQLPPPLPVDTARQTGQAVADAATSS